MSREIERQQAFEAEAISGGGTKALEVAASSRLPLERRKQALEVEVVNGVRCVLWVLRVMLGSALLYAVLYGLLYDTLYSRGRGR